MALGSGLLACAGTTTGDDAASLMAETTAGERRCVSAGDEEKLFVVDWDATDASTFQARADRDVVFVHYEACSMRVVEGCSDGSLAGRYGSYRVPVFTSGARDAFVVSTEDELRTKLPLGVATLGGELSAERRLELSYHVAGTALATRDEVYASELADNPRCADVTHMVVAYNLGAYRLATLDRTSEASGLEGGVTAKGSSNEERRAVRHAGDLAACTEVDNHACRVPIRLTLRAIRPGAPPVAGPAPQLPLPNSEDDPNLKAAKAMMSAVSIEAQARQKLMAHDGPGCLADLAQADRLDPQGKARRLQLRARCEMRSGDCEAGKEHFRQARRAFYRRIAQAGGAVPGMGSAAAIEAEAEQMASRECTTEAGGGRSAMNATLSLTQKIMVAAGRGDAEACVAHGQALSTLVEDTPPAHGAPSMQAAGGLGLAADCAAEGGKCTEAKALYAHKLKLMGIESGVDEAFALNVEGCDDAP